MSDGGGQRKPLESREILSKCQWRGDVFDPSTWEKPKPSYNLQDGSYRLTAEQLVQDRHRFRCCISQKVSQDRQ